MFHLRVTDACFPGSEHGDGVQRGKEAGEVLGLKREGDGPCNGPRERLGCRMRKAVVAWGGWAVPS